MRKTHGTWYRSRAFIAAPEKSRVASAPSSADRRPTRCLPSAEKKNRGYYSMCPSSRSRSTRPSSLSAHLGASVEVKGESTQTLLHHARVFPLPRVRPVALVQGLTDCLQGAALLFGDFIFVETESTAVELRILIFMVVSIVMRSWETTLLKDTHTRRWQKKNRKKNVGFVGMLIRKRKTKRTDKQNDFSSRAMNYYCAATTRRRRKAGVKPSSGRGFKEREYR